MTIKKKLVIIQLFTAFAVLAVSSAVFVQQEVRLFHANLVEQTTSTATLIGENSISTLLFMDDRAAEQLLLSLNVEAAITNACIYDGSGAVFARYGREGHHTFTFPPPVAEQAYAFKDGFLELSQPILRNGESTGTIFLRADLSQLGENIEEYVWNAILGLVISALLALLLQRTISSPILDLVTITRNVSETADYSQRARQRRGRRNRCAIHGLQRNARADSKARRVHPGSSRHPGTACRGTDRRAPGSQRQVGGISRIRTTRTNSR